jgi:adenylosuccinate synthase
LSGRHRSWCQVALKRATQINGINGVAITKLDVLDGLETIKVCIAYEYRGKRRELAPLDADGWDECKPVYLEFPGLQESTGGVRDGNQLPSAIRAYLRAIAVFCWQTSTTAVKLKEFTL